MKRKFMFAKIIAVLSFAMFVLLGINYFNAPPERVIQQSETMHTYLVKIPNSAGVCPYALMSMTKGKLKMIEDSHCICPYADNASYMTARCKDIRSVISMLPAQLQNKIRVKIVEENVKDTGTKFL